MKKLKLNLKLILFLSLFLFFLKPHNILSNNSTLQMGISKTSPKSINEFDIEETNLNSISEDTTTVEEASYNYDDSHDDEIIINDTNSTLEDTIDNEASIESLPSLDSTIQWSPNIAIKNLLLPDTNSEERIFNPTHIVLHFISNAYYDQNDPYNINAVYSILNSSELSTHYVIDRNGDIYMFTNENRVAYHAGRGQLANYPDYTNKLNHHSIGIEILGIGTKEEMIPIITEEKFNKINPSLIGFTESQYDSINILLDDILSRQPYIKRDREHIIGHCEYSPDKTDPGSLFQWSKIAL